MNRYIILLILLLSSSFSFAGKWVQVRDWAKPYKVNVNIVEESLWQYLKSNSSYEFESQSSYTYQYKTINDNELKIQAMCKAPRGVDLNVEFINGTGGGTCFFQIIYNLNTSTFTGLKVNASR